MIYFIIYKLKMVQNLYQHLVTEVTSAISKSISVAVIQVEGDFYTFINLPQPQKGGTIAQKVAYAKQKAQELVQGRGIADNEPIAAY